MKAGTLNLFESSDLGDRRKTGPTNREDKAMVFHRVPLAEWVSASKLSLPFYLAEYSLALVPS